MPFVFHYGVHMLTSRRVVLFVALLTAVPSLHAQYKALGLAQPVGEMQEIRSAILDSNNTKVIVYNYGQLTRPNTLANVADFVWKDLGYMFEFGPLFAAEVVDTNGQTVHIMDDGMWLPSQGGYSPDGTEKWGWLPRTGYARTNQSSIATANNPASWPESWSSWPGIDGPQTMRGVDEAYYVMDDFTNRKYAYYPFPDDTTKRGLGVSAQVWVTQSGPGMPDAVIVTWRLRNESPKDLPVCYFGFYGDPHVGGAADYDDDLVAFAGPAGLPGHPQVSDLVYTWDFDGIGMYGRPTGYFSFRYIQTPENKGLYSRAALPYTNTIPNVPKNDGYFWDLLSGGQQIGDEFSQIHGDYVIVFGTGPFALSAGDSVETSVIVFFSNSYEDMLLDATYLKTMWRWTNVSSDMGGSGGDPAYTVSGVTAGAGEVSGTTDIHWTYTGSDPSALVLLEVSRDGGGRWDPLVLDVPASSSYQWNTADYPDGQRYLLRAIAYDTARTTHAYAVSASMITVNNPGNATPEIVFEGVEEGHIYRNRFLTVNWRLYDADDDSVTLMLEGGLGPNGPFTLLHTATYPTDESVSYPVDLASVPNTPSYMFRLKASDGAADTVMVSGTFSVDVDAGTYTESPLTHPSGHSTATISLMVADTLLLTDHEYEVTFSIDPSGSPRTMSVSDLTAGGMLLQGYPLSEGLSTPALDGVKVLVHDTPPDIDTSRSGFTRPELNTIVNFQWQNILLNRVMTSEDWVLVFNDLTTLPDGSYAVPGDTALNQTGQPVVVLPFRAYNVTTGTKGKAFVREDVPLNNRWDSGEPILLRPDAAVSSQVSYQVNLDVSGLINPSAGDSLWIRTFDPLTSEDVFRYIPSKGFVAGVLDASLPVSPVLYPNYPNPFNPSTEISFQLSLTSHVSLTVFDLLGREVAVLIDGERTAGSHTVSWNAAGAASGMYVCKLEATGADGRTFMKTRKMILLR